MKAEAAAVENASFEKINQNYHSLTRKQKRILDALLAVPEDVGYLTLKEISERTDASEVTILRMCRHLGFTNFVDLKQAFRTHAENATKSFLETSYFSLDIPTSEHGGKESTLRRVLQEARTRSSEFYASVPAEKLLKTARQILDAHTVLICGQGVSALAAEYLYRRISPLILNVALIRPEDMDSVQAGLAKLSPGDHMIAFSFPRYFAGMRSIVLCAESCGATVTAIADGRDAPIVTANSVNYLCDTSTQMFYNSYTLPIELVNLIASAVVLEMGPDYDHLVARAHEVIRFINQSGAEHGRDSE